MNPDEIMKLDKHISQHEAEVCSLILEILVQCIPQKQNYNIIEFQLLFVLLANDLLRCAGYSKFTTNICPMPSTSLNGLRLNAQSIYGLFYVKKRGDDRYEQVCISNFEERISDKTYRSKHERQYNDIVFGGLSMDRELCGRKIDLLIRYGRNTKHLELSSIEFKKPSVTVSAASKQQCKNLRVNGAILNHLHGLNKKIHSLLAMDWIGKFFFSLNALTISIID